MGTDAYGNDDGWSDALDNLNDDPLERSLYKTVPPTPLPSDATDHQDFAAALTAIVKLDTLLSVSSNDLAEGLIARLALREASGWLAYAHIWIHHNDLGLRLSSNTGSFSAAQLTGTLLRAMPNSVTADLRSGQQSMDDSAVEAALQYARFWARLGRLVTWSPLTDAASVRDILNRLLPRPKLVDDALEAWLFGVLRRSSTPPLLRAVRHAREWMNLDGIPLDSPIEAPLLAASIWKVKSALRSVPLPFWSAPSAHHQKLAFKTGSDWENGFFICITRACGVAIAELYRLRNAEARINQIERRKSSKLKAGLQFSLRSPIITASTLAAAIGSKAQVSSSVINEMLDQNFLQEVTRRQSWRAFTLK